MIIHRPPGMGAFEFVVLAKLRAAQLVKGCRPRVEGAHKATVLAQLEVAAGKVTRAPVDTPALGEPATVSVQLVEELAVLVP